MVRSTNDSVKNQIILISRWEEHHRSRSWIWMTNIVILYHNYPVILMNKPQNTQKMKKKHMVHTHGPLFEHGVSATTIVRQ